MMTLKTYVITGAIIVTLLSSNMAATAFASGLGISEFNSRPELVCITHGDRPEMKHLCDLVNICDDSGRINSTHEFCTGEAVRNPPDAGCPEGFHWTGDESVLCYTNEGGCEDPDFVFTNNKQDCIQDDRCEHGRSMSKECIPKELFCSQPSIDMELRYIREYCFSNEDDCMPQLNGSRCDLLAYGSDRID